MYEKLLRPVSLKILEVLLSGSKSLTEMSQVLDMTKPTLHQKYLVDLESMGIVEKEIIKNERGKEARYRLLPFSLHLNVDPESGRNLSYFSKGKLDPGKALLVQIKENSFRDDLSKLLDEIGESDLGRSVEIIILFGSTARDEGTMKSDLDLLFIKDKWSDNDKNMFVDLLSGISYKLDHRIGPVFASRKELLESSEGIYNEIRNEGKIIFSRDGGGGDEIWKIMMRYRNISF